jgi:hypothetical protein
VLDGILFTYICYQHNGMYSENLDIRFFACQANTIYKYKNLKVKPINWNANIHFNRQCLIEHIVPNYAKNIKIPFTSPAAPLINPHLFYFFNQNPIRILAS